MVRIGLFGGVSAESDDGVPLDIGPAKCQAVLAVLALSAGSAVPVSRLVELVWGDEPPRTAEKTLQSYVVRLRTGLGADAILRTGAAYRLAVPSDAVDVARFRRKLEAGAVEAALVELGVAYEKESAPYELAFADSEENRMRIIRFLLAEHLHEMPIATLLAMFDRYSRGGEVRISTASDHYTVRRR